LCAALCVVRARRPLAGGSAPRRRRLVRCGVGVVHRRHTEKSLRGGEAVGGGEVRVCTCRDVSTVCKASESRLPHEYIYVFSVCARRMAVVPEEIGRMAWRLSARLVNTGIDMLCPETMKVLRSYTICKYALPPRPANAVSAPGPPTPYAAFAAMLVFRHVRRSVSLASKAYGGVVAFE